MAIYFIYINLPSSSPPHPLHMLLTLLTLCVLRVLCGETVHLCTVMNQILVRLPCILSDKSKYQSSFFITSQREDQELELK